MHKLQRTLKPGEVANVTNQELLAILDDTRFQRPNGIMEHEWNQGVKEARRALEALTVNIALREYPIKIVPHVCDPLDELLRLNPDFGKNFIGNTNIQRVRQEMALWLSVRFRLFSHPQFPALVDFLKERKGEVYISTIAGQPDLGNIATNIRNIPADLKKKGMPEDLAFQMIEGYLSPFLSQGAALNLKNRKGTHHKKKTGSKQRFPAQSSVSLSPREKPRTTEEDIMHLLGHAVDVEVNGATQMFFVSHEFAAPGRGSLCMAEQVRCRIERDAAGRILLRSLENSAAKPAVVRLRNDAPELGDLDVWELVLERNRQDDTK